MSGQNHQGEILDVNHAARLAQIPQLRNYCVKHSMEP